jgi:tRNA 5-methylaminomethyl-2-thiouridine biosynthesis bifunctional protein
LYLDGMKDPADDADGPLDWGPDGLPRSRAFGDVYFSAVDGLAESRAVFLAGCGLPQAWRGRPRYTVGELGFGTGLNILALLDLWRREGPPDGRLHVFSIEAFPLRAADAARALGAWPELADLAALLIGAWPGPARGWRRLELAGLRATIDLAFMDVVPALEGWTGRADAWFLDGFAPAANPGMWSPRVFELLKSRSAPGARAATFTVAGAVRRGLAEAGFSVAKRPGFGRKRERLEAWLADAAPPDAAPLRPAPARVAVIGAGIAGAAAARAVRALGGEAVVFDPAGSGGGASGNPAALVTPRLDAGGGAAAGLFAHAFTRATALYETVPGAVVARGVLQRPARPADLARFARIIEAGLFDEGALALGEDGLDQVQALTIVPGAVLGAWTGAVRRVGVAGVEPDAGRWRLLDVDGAEVARADAVILAAGLGSAGLAPGLDLAPVRGQASWAAEPGLSPSATAWGGYAVPLPEGGVLFGATHDRGDEACDLRPGDHARNLATLGAALPALAARLEGRALEGRAAVRAVTPDRLPVAGPAPGAPAGLFVLGGLGSRGFAHAPLLAEHLAALILGAPSPLPAEAQALLDPSRFARRAARRQGGRSRVEPE